MTFNPRTATQEEFEAEARRLHAGRMERIQNMTAEEMQACARFMMDGYLQRAATLRLNEIFTVEDMDIQIARCVDIWRTDNFQSSAEYEAERDRLIEADRARKQAEASERARREAAARNARARWIAQGNDPSILPPEGVIERGTALARTEAAWAERRAREQAAPQADIVVDVPDESLHDIIVSAAKEHLNKGKWAGTLRIVGPGGDQQFDEAGNEIEADADPETDRILEGIAGAIEFHRTRTRLQRNIDQWNAIRDAIVAGSASAALKARVERAASGARSGGRYYELWMAVRDRIRSLPDG